MSTYMALGSRFNKGVADTTQLNPGNWTVTFAPSDMAVDFTLFEVYKIVIAGASGTTAVIQIDNRTWDIVQRADLNSWEATGAPLPLTDGQTLYFFWSDPVSDATPPAVTIWLRADLDIPSNKVT